MLANLEDVARPDGHRPALPARDTVHEEGFDADPLDEKVGAVDAKLEAAMREMLAHDRAVPFDCAPWAPLRRSAPARLPGLIVSAPSSRP